MVSVGADTFDQYRTRLEDDSEEFSQLFNTFLINVTAFFRDGEPWEYMAEQVIPKLLAEKRKFDGMRIWTAGCATGEEAYTLAMLLTEALGTEEFRSRVKIYATDIDDHALSLARQATYEPKQMETVPTAYVDRYFERVNGNYCFRKDIRRSIVFGRHDILHDAPISRIDLLSCRNTLMYFNASAQARILARMHFSLTDGGFLLLGRAETLLAHTSTFRAVDLKQRVFSKVPATRLAPQLYLMSPGENGARVSTGGDEDIREQALNTSGVAQILIDRSGHLSAANDMARNMFGLTIRDIGAPFHNLELSYKPIELRSLIDQAYHERRTINVSAVEHEHLPGDSTWLEVKVIPLVRKDGEIGGVSVVFTDVTTARRLQQALERTNLEFESAAEQLQSTNEEMETTNEELQSAVEELETTNEELQASYEELETMNEELQSTNEELQAMNDVARAYTTELDTANHLLESIFSGLGGRVIVVDHDLIVTYWNKGAEDLWGLRALEVVNTQLTALDFGLPLEPVHKPLERILEGKSERETLDVEAINRKGKPVLCHTTIAPLMALEGDSVIGAILIVADEPLPVSSPASRGR